MRSFSFIVAKRKRKRFTPHESKIHTGVFFATGANDPQILSACGNHYRRNYRLRGRNGGGIRRNPGILQRSSFLGYARFSVQRAKRHAYEPHAANSYVRSAGTSRAFDRFGGFVARVVYGGRIGTTGGSVCGNARSGGIGGVYIQLYSRVFHRARGRIENGFIEKFI